MTRDFPLARIFLSACSILLFSTAGAVLGDAGEIQSEAQDAPRVVPMEPLPPEPDPGEVVPLEPLRPLALALEPPSRAANAVAATIRDWAVAWSEQRIVDYLAFYSGSFQPSDGSSRSQWIRTRHQRLSAPSFIRVTLGSMKFRVLDTDQARVEFLQSYSSSSYDDVVVKRLDLAREDGSWRIVGEEVLSTEALTDFEAGAFLGTAAVPRSEGRSVHRSAPLRRPDDGGFRDVSSAAGASSSALCAWRRASLSPAPP